MSTKSFAIIGDVHGCADELEELLGKIPTDNHVVFLGDLVDRGPDSPRCVDIAYELHRQGRATLVKGNHDHSLVRYFEYEQGSTPNPMRAPRPSRLAEWESVFKNGKWMEFLHDAPSYLEFLPGFFAVHAGLLTTDTPDAQKVRIHTHLRYVDVLDHSKMKPLTEDLDEPADSIYWAEVYNRPNTVFYGHHVHNLETPRVRYHHRTEAGVHFTCGLDTGCVYGGRLTAALVTELAPFHPTYTSVKARHTYFHNHLLAQRV